MLKPKNIAKKSKFGEILVAQKFDFDPNCKDYYVLHSLFLSQHLSQMSGEIDFLVLAPGKGIFALEVKNANVSRKDGLWIYQDNYGQEYSLEKSPFQQVHDSAKTLQKWIAKATKKAKLPNDFSKLIIGWGVLFPSMDKFENYGTECETWQICTKISEQTPISNYIDALSTGFINKTKHCTWFDPNKSIPTANDCHQLYRLLRGDFNHDYSHINKIKQQEEHIEEYTQKQFDILENTILNPRCWVEGGAGTGKTIMALELWLRKIREGKKVALLCYNKLIGDHLKQCAEKLFPKHGKSAFVGTFHAYLTKETGLKIKENEEEDQFYNQTLPLEFLVNAEDFDKNEKFDYLIIDEAQDLITDSNLHVFEAMLKGGISDGHWSFFGDFSQQSIYHENADSNREIINQKASNFKGKLVLNCRNAQKIATQNVLITGFPYKQNNFMPQGECSCEFHLSAKAIEKVEQLIKNYQAEGTSMRSITILSTKNWTKSTLTQSAYLQNLIQAGNGLTFHTIHSFKGMENSIIIIADIDDLNEPKLKELLYIGISRAKLELHLVLPEHFEKFYKQQVQQNSQLL